MTAPLPDLPPGWAWWREGRTVDLRAGGVLWAWYYLADSGAVAVAADEAHDITDALLCAAIEAIATDAGVVLPDDYDPAAVLRDGVRAQVRAVRRADGEVVALPDGAETHTARLARLAREARDEANRLEQERDKARRELDLVPALIADWLRDVACAAETSRPACVGTIQELADAIERNEWRAEVSDG